MVDGARFDLESFEFSDGSFPPDMTLQPDEALAHLLVTHSAQPTTDVPLDDDRLGLAPLLEESVPPKHTACVPLDGADGTKLAEIGVARKMSTPYCLDDSSGMSPAKEFGLSVEGRDLLHTIK